MKSVILALCLLFCAGFAALAQADERAPVPAPSFSSTVLLTTGLENAALSLAAIGRCCSKTGSVDDTFSMSCHSDSKPFVAASIILDVEDAPAFAETEQPHRVYLTTSTFFRPPIT